MQNLSRLLPMWEALSELQQFRCASATNDSSNSVSKLLQLCASPDGPLQTICQVYSSIARWAVQLQDARTLHDFMIELLSFAKTAQLWKGATSSASASCRR
eukprot:COSAG02_NODE_8427_length_2573_cov_11.247373_2_plen_101_part_00